MGYTPPSHNSVNIEHKSTYVPPDYDNVNIQFGKGSYKRISVLLKQVWNDTSVYTSIDTPYKYLNEVAYSNIQSYHYPIITIRTSIYEYIDSSTNTWIDRTSNNWIDNVYTAPVRTYIKQVYSILYEVITNYTIQLYKIPDNAHTLSIQTWHIPLYSASTQTWNITETLNTPKSLFQIWDLLLVTYSKQNYHLIPSLLNISKQSYQLTYCPINTNKQLYTNYKVTTKTLKQLYTDYSIIYNNIEQLYTDAVIINTEAVQNWDIFSVAYNITSQEYFIASVLIKTEVKQTYKIPLEVGHTVLYEIKEPIEAQHISLYNINTYDRVQAAHVVKYEFVQSGIFGISDRLVGFFGAWSIEQDNRDIHLHLFNTHINEKTLTYTRYYVSAANIRLEVVREIIFNERSTTFERFAEHISEKNIRVPSFSESIDERSVHVPGFQEYKDEQEILLSSQELNIPSERIGFVWCKDNTYRYCFAKSWHVFEFWCITHAKEKDVLATQRTCLGQIEQLLFTSIRNVTYAACNLSFQFIINPIEVLLFNKEVRSGVGGPPESGGPFTPGTEVALFENRIVVPDTNEFYTLPINFDLADVDLLLLEKDSEQPIYCSRRSILFQNFTQITTNTYEWDGHIIPLKDVIFVKITFEFFDKGPMTNEEYFEYLTNYGYLKIVLNGEHMTQNESIVMDSPATMLIPFTIQVLDEELDKENMNMTVTWAYPYHEIKVNKILLVGTKSTT